MKHRAPAAAGVVSRPRLFESIDSHVAAQIVWIAAPAGSGKSSLLAGYLRTLAAPWLWYQVDDADADPALLFLALAKGSAGLAGDGSLPVYDASCARRLRAFSRQFAAALVARHGAALVLVLDDFHDAPSDSALAEVLRDMAGTGLHLLVASRLAPPAAFSRMRMHGELALLSWAELRLTLDEARALLAPARDAPAANEARLATLYRLSDGWAAGLLLLSRSDDLPETGLRPDAPDRRLLAEYLHREVMAHASAGQRRALVATALLPEFDEPALAALLGAKGSAELLAELQVMPFFVRRGDGAGTWTHHPLLRQFLQAHMAKEFPPTQARELCRRAAQGLLGRGDVDAGLRLLHEHATPPELAAALLGHARVWLAQGRAASIEAWIGRLPPEQMQSEPWLNYWLGRALTPHNPASAAPPLELAAQRFRSEGNPRGLLLACAALLEAVSYGYAELQRLEPWLAEAATLVPDMAHWLDAGEQVETMAALFAALVIRQRPHPLLPAWRERALALADRSAHATLRAYVFSAAVMSHVWTGDYASASVIGERLREQLGSPAVAALPRLTGWLALSVLAGNMPGPEPDYRCVESGLEAARRSGVHVWDAELHGQAAVIALAANDRERAAAALTAMAKCLPPGPSVHSAGYHSFCAWNDLLAADAAGAARCAELARADALAAGSEPLLRHASVMAAQAAMLAGDARQAREHMDGLMQGESRTANPRARFVRLLLDAEFARRDGRLDDACAHLQPAMALARETGYTAYYGWLPEVMGPLALLALERGIEVDHVRSLARLRRLPAGDAALNIEAWPWPVRLWTLGGVRLTGLGVPARSGVRTPHKPIELLCALVAFGGRNVAEAAVCDALWPEAEGDAARRALAVNLHRLRGLFGDARAVTLTSGRLSLDRSALWVDVAALEQLFDGAEGHDAQPHDRLDRVLALYRGPFLGEAPTPWGERKRVQLRRRFVWLVSRELRAMLERGLASVALPQAYRACEAEPADKTLAELLAHTQSAAGQPARLDSA